MFAPQSAKTGNLIGMEFDKIDIGGLFFHYSLALLNFEPTDI